MKNPKEELRELSINASNERPFLPHPMHTIFCSGYDNNFGFIATALADDGHVVAQHCCSHIGYAHHDLGLEGTWQHDKYDKHFGAGNWKLEWVDPASVKTHPGWQAALALNRQHEAKDAAETAESMREAPTT